MDTIAGKNVLITGAAMGMGRLYAEWAVREKAAVIALWDVNHSALEITVNELRSQGATVMPYVVDLSRREEIEQAAQRMLQEIGDIDILFNNAGIVRGKYFWEHDNVGDTTLTLAVNTLAPMYVARAVLPAMIAGGRESRIVNIASAAGLLSNPRMSVYCASKWALIGWSDSLRLELEQAGHRHVKVTTVCPSYIATGMFDGVRGPLFTPILRPQTVVDRVWHAMKSGRPFLTMPWTVRFSMLMRGLLPLPLWDFVAGRVFGVYRSMDRFKGH